MNFDRRDFCKLSAFSALPWVLGPRLAFASGAADRDVLICIFQRGGMDGLNAVAPYADTRYRTLRPTIGLPEPGAGQGALLDLDGFFGLNPAAAALQPLYAAGELAIVHACGGLHGDLSHFSAQDLMERGCLAHMPVFSGWLNRHLEIIGAGSEFQGVGVGKSVPLALRGEAPVLGMGSIEGFTLSTVSDRAQATPALLQLLYHGSGALEQAGTQAFAAIDAIGHADPASFAVENGASYPQSEFGSQMREVGQLIKAGIGLEVACVDIGGWDHHDQLNAQLTPLLQDLADTLAAFRTDLGKHMATISVVVMTEFGRRAYENASGGTDHGIGGVMFALGGGVNGGQIYVDWPGLADEQLLRGNLQISIDYRSVLSELLAKRAGNNAVEALFPEFQDAGALGIFRAR